MKRKTFNQVLHVKLFYDVKLKKTCVGFNGDTPIAYCPIRKRSYAYGTDSWVKRGYHNYLVNIKGYEAIKKVFEKTIEKNFKDTQGGVYALIDVENEMSNFGAWNSDSKDDKYTTSKITSFMEVSNLEPLDPIWTASIKRKGFMFGDKNSVTHAIIDNKLYESVEDILKSEMAENIKKDYAKKFKNLRQINMYEDKTRANGLYTITLKFDFEKYCRYDITSQPLLVSDEKKAELLEKGWKSKTIDNHEYLMMPFEQRLDFFKDVIESVFNWEPDTNTSLGGNGLALLRIVITKDNFRFLKKSTYIREIDGEEYLMCEDNTPTRPKDTYIYNTNLMYTYPTHKTICPFSEPSFDADEQAQSKIVELATEIMLNQEKEFGE